MEVWEYTAGRKEKLVHLTDWLQVSCGHLIISLLCFSGWDTLSNLSVIQNGLCNIAVGTEEWVYTGGVNRAPKTAWEGICPKPIMLRRKAPPAHWAATVEFQRDFRDKGVSLKGGQKHENLQQQEGQGDREQCRLRAPANTHFGAARTHPMASPPCPGHPEHPPLGHCREEGSEQGPTSAYVQPQGWWPGTPRCHLTGLSSPWEHQGWQGATRALIALKHLASPTGEGVPVGTVLPREVHVPETHTACGRVCVHD